MTLDGLTLHVCVNELQDTLAGAKIQKVLMPEREELVLQLYTPHGGNMKLCISADAGDCGLYLTTAQKQNPKVAPAFCMFLRKHLTGARIAGISQDGLDRVVHIELDAKDELLHPVKLSLIIEIMGKYSNIILVNGDGRVLDSIKRVTPDLSSLRQVLPGTAYEQPPQKKYNPLTLSQVSMAELIHTHKDTALIGHIVTVFDGISTQTAAEILCRAGARIQLTSQLSDKLAVRIANVMHGFFQDAIAHPAPCVQHNADDMPIFFSSVPYETYPEETRVYFENCNEMLDYYYSRRLEISRIRQQKEALIKKTGQLLGKLVKRIRIYEADVTAAQKSSKLQKRADLITANLYQLKKGMLEFKTVDYETGETVTIPLDPSLPPQGQAQKLYKKIAKLKRGAQLSAEKLAQARDEEDFLLGVQHYAERASKSADIEEIKLTLQKAGYFSPPPKGKKATSGPPDSQPLSFTSPTGFTILVGKNDRQNDMITMRLAEKDDIWFHAQKIPGSHVLLQTGGVPLDDIDDDTVVMAARLAAQNSRARQAGKTPVDYTQRKNIKKPPAAKPGKVIYDDYFTIYVDAASTAEDSSLST